MRLISFRDPCGETREGVIADERVIDLTPMIAALIPPASIPERGLTAPANGMLRLLYAGAQGMAAVRRYVNESRTAGGIERLPLWREVALIAPVPRPGKVVAIGRNYADHAKETGVLPFERPRIIAKLSSSVVGPGAVVQRPAAVSKLDFEAELAVVMGGFASHVPRDRALEMVAGYTVLNDLSAREFQFDVAPPQTTFAKSMDGFCPMGPWLMTVDEIADPQVLDIKSFVNNRPMQHGNSADMLFPVDRLIEYLSQFMTLEPGDVIATGTPAGSGAFRDPPVWLKPGDRVRIEIAQIGTLEHSIG
jgi:2-keto-4-pentenoate hydratase/2-oxohepta-3-ene-1,7-dioic acid hydratase in catechol pathway